MDFFCFHGLKLDHFFPPVFVGVPKVAQKLGWPSAYESSTKDWQPRGCWETQQEILWSSYVLAFWWRIHGRTFVQMHGGSEVHWQIVRSLSWDEWIMGELSSAIRWVDKCEELVVYLLPMFLSQRNAVVLLSVFWICSCFVFHLMILVHGQKSYTSSRNHIPANDRCFPKCVALILSMNAFRTRTKVTIWTF